MSRAFVESYTKTFRERITLEGGFGSIPDEVWNIGSGSGSTATTTLSEAIFWNGAQFKDTDYPLVMNGVAIESAGDVEIDGALNHDGSTVGLFGVTPASRAGATDDIKDALTTYGLLQGTSATPLNLDGGTLTCAIIDASSDITGAVLKGTMLTHSLGNNNTLTIQNRSYTAADNALEMATGTFSNTSGTSSAVAILPTYNQTSGTAANTDLLINRTETAVGSGLQYFLDCKVGSVSRARILNTGAAEFEGSSDSQITLNPQAMDDLSGNSINVSSDSSNGRGFTLDYRGAWVLGYRAAASSGTESWFKLTGATIAQSGTAGYTLLDINATESSTGSGDKYLANFQVGGASKFFIRNTGTFDSLTSANHHVVSSASTPITNDYYLSLGWSSNVGFIYAVQQGVAGVPLSLGNGAPVYIGATSDDGSSALFQVAGAGSFSDTVTGTQLYQTHQTLTDGANISWDLNSGGDATVTLAGNRTLDNPTNMVAGGTYTLIVKQDGTGSRTLAYGNAYKWPGGVAPVLTTTASATDILTFKSDGTYMYGVSAENFA